MTNMQPLDFRSYIGPNQYKGYANRAQVPPIKSCINARIWEPIRNAIEEKIQSIRSLDAEEKAQR